MKRITMLVLALAMVLGGALAASAEHIKGGGGEGLEFNAKGSWRLELGWVNNADDFTDEVGDADDFNARIRARTWFEFIASENLKAVLGTEIGDVDFGRGGGALGTDAIAIEVKHAYLQFALPNTPVTLKAGLQGVATPGNLGSLVLDDDVAAILAVISMGDMGSLTTGWIRPVDPNGANKGDTVDVFPLIANLKAGDMAALQPYFIYANIGEEVFGDSGSQAAYWLGVSAQIKPIADLAILIDAVYGNLTADDDTLEASGFGTVLAAAYTVNAGAVTMTPTLFGLYFTGEDDDADDGSERMPDVAGNFVGTSFGFGGSNFSTDSVLTAFNEGTGWDAAQANPANIGLWAVGIAINKLSFVPKLTHNISLWYGMGTNDEDAVAIYGNNLFTKEDSGYEFNFDTTYKIYEQLSAIAEFGYLKANMDDDLGTRGDDYLDDAAWKATFGFKYVF